MINASQTTVSAFNILSVENAAKEMIRRAQSKVEELTRKTAEEEERYRMRREDLANEYRIKRESMEQELAEARKRTEEELDALRKEVTEKTEKEAHERGCREGLEEGRKTGEEEGRKQAHREALSEYTEKYREEFERMTHALATVTGGINAKRNALFRDAEHDVISLAISIAEKIVKHDIEVRPDSLINNVKKALGIIAAKNSAKIEVNPDDVALLEEHAPKALEIFREKDSFTVSGNPEVQPGGCMVTSIHGGADLRISTQLELVEQALLGEEQGEKVSTGNNIAG